MTTDPISQLLASHRRPRGFRAHLTYDTTKTKGSDRRVPLMPHTAQLLTHYLAEHQRVDEPTAPLFCALTLAPVGESRNQRGSGRTGAVTSAPAGRANDVPAVRAR